MKGTSQSRVVDRVELERDLTCACAFKLGSSSLIDETMFISFIDITLFVLFVDKAHVDMAPFVSLLVDKGLSTPSVDTT